MKLFMLSLPIIGSLILAFSASIAASNIPVSSTSSSFLSKEAGRIVRRGDRPSSSRRLGVVPPHKKQRTESPPPSPPGSPSNIKPESIRAIESQAVLAEKKASAARTHFRQVGEFNLQRAKDQMSRPIDPDPEKAHRNRMTSIHQYRAVAQAKTAQAEAYKEASEATDKAGLPYRYFRNKIKAETSEMMGIAHHVNLDMHEHASKEQLESIKYQQGVQKFGTYDPRTMSAQIAAIQAASAKRQAGERSSEMYREANRLRRERGGRDTDSEISG